MLGPMFPPGPFARFLQRVSAGYYGWLDLREVLDIEPFYSPVGTFALFNRYPQANQDRAVELLSKREYAKRGEHGHYVIHGEHVSSRPIHDGYVTLLELVPGTAEDVPARLHAFMKREADRDAEDYVRTCYGETPEVRAELNQHEVFRFMDYPHFDNGSGAIGFGLMITRDAAWLWSRIAFAHK